MSRIVGSWREDSSVRRDPCGCIRRFVHGRLQTVHCALHTPRSTVDRWERARSIMPTLAERMDEIFPDNRDYAGDENPPGMEGAE